MAIALKRSPGDKRPSAGANGLCSAGVAGVLALLQEGHVAEAGGSGAPHREQGGLGAKLGLKLAVIRRRRLGRADYPLFGVFQHLDMAERNGAHNVKPHNHFR